VCTDNGLLSICTSPSGTYNNQWMVFDVATFSKGWEHDVLWVLEQLPGITEQVSASDICQTNTSQPLLTTMLLVQHCI
jgi:hypothetical protein